MASSDEQDAISTTPASPAAVSSSTVPGVMQPAAPSEHQDASSCKELPDYLFPLPTITGYRHQRRYAHGAYPAFDGEDNHVSFEGSQWTDSYSTTSFSTSPQYHQLTSFSEDRGPEYSIFVGDLGPEVNEYVLVSLFQSRFPSCKSAKIMTDAMSGQSRGYGFVRFSDENDQQRALMEMQGVYCGNRPMRVSTATPKNR